MVNFLIIAIGLILVWTSINRLFLPSIAKQPTSMNEQQAPLLTIMVPMRNEERNVAGLLTSLSNIDYPNKEFIFLNDGSTDNTLALLHDHCKQIERARIITGESLPSGWVGKVHACYQLSKHAQGKYLAFVDADIRLEPSTFTKGIRLLVEKQAGLLTGFPHFPTASLLSKLLVPMQHVIVLLHLPLFMANLTKKPAFTAAHGAFMLFTREAYLACGGHEAVKSSLVEDVHITRAVKRSGYRAILGSITSHVQCFMYETNKEVWNGFSKNIFPGIGRSIPLALVISVFYLVFFIIPFPMAIYGLISQQWVLIVPLLLTFILRYLIDRSMNQEAWLWLYMPLAALCLLCVLYRSMYRSIFGQGFIWKGRRYQ